MTDSQNSDTTAPNGRALYHLQFSLQAASPKTFGYTLMCFHSVFVLFGSFTDIVGNSEFFVMHVFRQ
jgi:hypothetical protein